MTAKPKPANKAASSPTVVELDVEQMEAHLDEFEQAFGEEKTRPFRMLIASYVSLADALQEKNMTIARMRRMIFGAQTERTRNVVSGQNANDSADDSANDTAAPQSETEKQQPINNCESDAADASETTTGGSQPRRARPRRGHGRIPAADYTGCDRKLVTHDAFTPGDDCPHCADGTLCRLREWSCQIRLKGQPPVGGMRYEMERLRCTLCGKVETAELPPEAGDSKYGTSVSRMIAVLHYGEGMPWSRIERVQQSAGIPLPASVQWGLVRDAANQGPGAVYEHLLSEAAQGELFHNDDTRMRILELTSKRNKGEPLRADAPHRRGVCTTSILSVAQGRPDIALFVTGPHHAGENLRDMLRHRAEGKPPPLQMCDALSHNLPGEMKTIVAHCLSHARRNFVELADAFPGEVLHVLTSLKRVYRADSLAAHFGLSDEKRLLLHQRRSAPVMNELHDWLSARLSQRLVEPNSSLGKSISYMLKHWQELTRFLHVPGAPLDNNIAERALKMAIRYRKNSMFYKTQRGASVGDIYMSLIHTCRLANIEPFAYLTALQENADQVKAGPSAWLPWNYPGGPSST